MWGGGAGEGHATARRASIAAFQELEALSPLRPDLRGLVGQLASLGREALAGAPASRLSRWRRAHPGGRFSDYYAERVAENLARRRHHRTLGCRPWSSDKLAGQVGYLDLLRAGGLKPHHRCIEYGCGSLRIGRHLVEYLDREGYVGLDVSDRFFGEGLAAIGGAGLQEKQPELYVIEADLLAELAATPPDFVFSIAVLHHVHPSELDDYLANVLMLLGPGSQALLTFREWRTRIQTAAKSWSHPARDLVERVRRLEPAARVRVQRVRRRRVRWDPSWKSLLWIDRGPKAP